MGSTTLSPAGKIADRENLALHGTDNPGLELDAATDQQREELIRPTPPRRAKPGNPPFPNIPAASASSPRVALLSGDQRVWAERLMAEIENDVAPRAEFASAWLGNICRSARILALNGIPALGNMRRAPRRGRDFLDDGIRKAGYSYINIHFAPRILEPPPPHPAPRSEECTGKPPHRHRGGAYPARYGLILRVATWPCRDKHIQRRRYPRPRLTYARIWRKHRGFRTTRPKNGRFRRGEPKCGDFEVHSRPTSSASRTSGFAGFYRDCSIGHTTNSAALLGILTY